MCFSVVLVIGTGARVCRGAGDKMRGERVLKGNPEETFLYHGFYIEAMLLEEKNITGVNKEKR